MSRENYKESESIEDKAVWDLLKCASDSAPQARFVDDTVRMVKTLPEASGVPLYHRFTFAVPAFALAACGLFGLWLAISPAEEIAPIADASPSEEMVEWSEIQEEAEIEMLIAAADYLDQYSGQELFNLIGL